MPENLRTTIAQLIQRVDAIESTIGVSTRSIDHGQGHDRRLSKSELARRWSVSTRSIDRAREADPNFPTGVRDYAGGPLFWWLSQITRYERERAVRVEQLPPRDDRRKRRAQ
jgi:hypothetical protein